MMAAKYDGKLAAKGGKVVPCCEKMNDYAVKKLIIAEYGKLYFSARQADRIFFCPFCGASVGAT